jgi:hypothetical protein
LQGAGDAGVGELVDDPQLDGVAHRLRQRRERLRKLPANVLEPGALLDLGDQRVVARGPLEPELAQRALLGVAAPVVESELPASDAEQPAGGLRVGRSAISAAGRPRPARTSPPTGPARPRYLAVRRTRNTSNASRCRA